MNMNKTIAFNWNSDEVALDKLIQSREIFYASDQKEAYLFHIENSEVDSYILNCEGMNIVDVKSIIRHIQYLNAIINIILYKAEYGVFESILKNGNIHIADSGDEIINHLNDVSRAGRSSNRIQWPLRVEFWDGSADGKDREQAIVTSLSSGGCFLKTANSENRSKGDHLSLLFHFRDFDFLAEARIVRMKVQSDGTPEGIALEFIEVSPQTERYIQEIIDEKILSEIMDKIS